MSSRRREPTRHVRILPAAVALAVAFAAGAEPVDPPPPLPRCGVVPVEWEAAGETVLEVRVGGVPAADAILAFERDGALFLPLGELARAFELAIDVDPYGGRAFGWVVREERRFELDLGSCRLVVDGEPRSLAGLELLRPGDDLYLAAERLADWLPVTFEWDRRNSRLLVRSHERLPVELRLDRERRRRFGFATPALRDSGLYREEPYRLWNLPYFDTNVLGRTFRDRGRSRDWRVESDANASADLLWMSSRVFYSGRSDGLHRLRMNAGRRDVSGRMTPLGLTEFAVGDVGTPNLTGVARSTAGRGVQFSNVPLDRAGDLASLTLEGDLPQGWDVELYRDDLLLDFQQVGADQRFVFEGVPTQPGLNVFRLAYYGPRGEQREEERRIWASGALVEPGRVLFRLAANQHRRDLVEFGDTGVSDEDRGGLRGVGEIEVGLVESLSLALGAATLPVMGDQRHYGTLGLRGRALGVFTQADAYGNHEGGWAAGGSLQTRALDHTLTASHHHFDEFLSERNEFDGGELLRSQSRLAVDGSARWLPLPLTYRVSAEHDRLRNGLQDTDVEVRASTWLFPVVISNAMSARFLSGVQSTRSINGQLAARARFGAFLLRSRFDYVVDPADASYASVALDWRQANDRLLRAEVGYDFEGGTLVGLSLGWRFGVVVLSTSADVNERGHVSAAVGLSFGLAPNPIARRYEMQRAGAASRGGLAARVFLDRNANGSFDGADLPLPDVALKVHGVPDVRSGVDGTTFVGGMPVDRPTPVGIDPSSLEDPLWVAPEEPIPVVLRPGVSTQLDFPVVPTGEVDGMVWLERDGELRAAAGVELVLLDRWGSEVRRQRSEIDGFYLFDRLPPGRYRLRVAALEARRRQATAPPAFAFEIEPSGNVVSGRDLVLRVD